MGTADVSSFVRFVGILSNPGGRSCAETGINVCINLLFLASKNSCNTDPDKDGASSAANSRIYCKHQSVINIKSKHRKTDIFHVLSPMSES